MERMPPLRVSPLVGRRRSSKKRFKAKQERLAVANTNDRQSPCGWRRRAFFHSDQNGRANTQKNLSTVPTLDRGRRRWQTVSCSGRVRFCRSKVCRERKTRRRAPIQSWKNCNIEKKVIASQQFRKLCRLLISEPDGVSAKHRQRASGPVRNFR